MIPLMTYHLLSAISISVYLSIYLSIASSKNLDSCNVHEIEIIFLSYSFFMLSFNNGPFWYG